MATGKYSLFNIFRNGLFYMAVVEAEIPALFVLEFLKRTYDVHSIYLDNKVTAGKIRENFTTVYQLFEEMSDHGYPVLTEPNVLTAMVTPPSVVSRLAAAVGVRTGLQAARSPHSAHAPDAPAPGAGPIQRGQRAAVGSHQRDALAQAPAPLRAKRDLL